MVDCETVGNWTARHENQFKSGSCNVSRLVKWIDKNKPAFIEQLPDEWEYRIVNVSRPTRLEIWPPYVGISGQHQWRCGKNAQDVPR